jgi:hypothetical protein
MAPAAASEPAPLRIPEPVAAEEPPAPEPTPPDPVAPAPDPVVSPTPRRRSRGRRVAVWLAAIAATAGVGAFLLMRSPHPPSFAALAAAFGQAPAPTPEEARALVEQFRQAHEERDAGRLAALFAPDATGNGQRGADDIARSYRDLFTRLTRISYAVPSVSVTPDGSRTIVSAPFRMDFHSAQGDGNLHGSVLWTLERRYGEPRIVALRYTFDPDSGDDTATSH